MTSDPWGPPPTRPPTRPRYEPLPNISDHAVNQARAALEWRALLNGIVAAILIGVGILVSWASGAFNDEPGHRENGAAAFIAGIIALVGIGAGVRAWRCYRASRDLGRMR